MLEGSEGDPSIWPVRCNRFSRRSRNSLHPLPPFPFDLTRAALLLGWRNACVEALGLPAETRAGVRCPEIAETGLWPPCIHCSSQPTKAGQATKGSRQPTSLPFAAQRAAGEQHRDAVSQYPKESEGTGPVLLKRHLLGNYTPTRLIARLRFFPSHESHWKFDGLPDGWQARRARLSRRRHDSVSEEEDLSQRVQDGLERWMTSMLLWHQRQCAQHPPSLPCRPRSIRHCKAEVAGWLPGRHEVALLACLRSLGPS